MSFDTPQAVAAELKLFTENDGDIYRQQTSMILKNLAAKKASGRYDHDRAVDMFMHLAETGARKYLQEFGGLDVKSHLVRLPHPTWHEVFPKDIRRIVASEWRDEFEVEYANGAYEALLPKKYQGLLGQGHLASQSQTALHTALTARLAGLGFHLGERVSMHPATDAFMMGDRYGTVAKIGKSKIHVKMDKSGRTRLVLPGNLQHMEELGSI
jgi:hypothetical protein